MATRFYLPYTGTASISPAYSASWQDTSIVERLNCVITKISSTMTTISFVDTNSSAKNILFRQYISEPLAAQTIAVQALKFQMRCNETDALNNMYLTMGIRVVSSDGSTVRGTILAVTKDNTESSTTLTNRQFTANSTEVISQVGDRIVIELGMGGLPAPPWPGPAGNHSSSISIGDDSGTDLPENNTTTTAYNPWVEFADTLEFIILSDEDETLKLSEDVRLEVGKKLKQALKISTTIGLSFLTFTTQSESLKIGAVPGLKIIYGNTVTEALKISESVNLKAEYKRDYSDALKIRADVSAYLYQKNKPLANYEPKYLIDMALTGSTYHFSGEDIYITT